MIPDHYRHVYEWTVHSTTDEMADHLRRVHCIPVGIVRHLKAVGHGAVVGFHLADHDDPIYLYRTDHAHPIPVRS